jgi:beta-lactamase class A
MSPLHTIIKKYKLQVTGVLIVGLLVLTFFLGRETGERSAQEFIEQFKPLRISFNGGKYISPLIGVESPEATEIDLYSDLKKSVEVVIADAKEKGEVLGVSVYFRDLNTSLWFGINKEEAFYPASLLKLPYAFTGYKFLEENHHDENRRYVYTEEIATINKVRASASPSDLVVGRGYTLEELIVSMVEHSDNGARDMLAILLSEDGVNETFSIIGVNLPVPTSEYEITTEKYARFLRMLYSASYLNENNSNKLLSLLTKTDFDYALTKYLPKTVEVAHKWGVVNLPVNREGVTPVQFHDCGIVYHRDSPYALCVMTKGQDQLLLAETVAKISKKVFEYIENK